MKKIRIDDPLTVNPTRGYQLTPDDSRRTAITLSRVLLACHRPAAACDPGQTRACLRCRHREK